MVASTTWFEAELYLSVLQFSDISVIGSNIWYAIDYRSTRLFVSIFCNFNLDNFIKTLVRASYYFFYNRYFSRLNLLYSSITVSISTITMAISIILSNLIAQVFCIYDYLSTTNVSYFTIETKSIVTAIVNDYFCLAIFRQSTTITRITQRSQSAESPLYLSE